MRIHRPWGQPHVYSSPNKAINPSVYKQVIMFQSCGMVCSTSKLSNYLCHYLGKLFD